MRVTAGVAAAVVFALVSGAPAEETYPWLAGRAPVDSIGRGIAPPAGYVREEAKSATFAAWLRGLPLRVGRGTVFLFDGRKKGNQKAHHRVLDIDVGKRDLQQCADAVMRLRAEFLLSQGHVKRIHFNFTSGHRADYTKWRAGYRPVVRGAEVRWVKSAQPDASYAGFRKYMNIVFAYAGTASLARELVRVDDPKDVRVGDVYIHPGHPGHAVIVIDVAVNRRTGRRVFLLAQRFMPAQDIHVLRNPNDRALSPWFDAAFGKTLRTPEWTFAAEELKRFGDR